MQNHYTVSNLIDAKNLKQLNLLGTLPNEKILYFFCREEKILLPMFIKDFELDTTGANHKVQKFILHVCKLFHASVEKIIISLRSDQSYNACIRIRKNKSSLDFVLNIADSVQLGLIFNVPIFISSQLLRNDGIKVTKEMLEDYLK